jgi:hypothetical protein
LHRNPVRSVAVAKDVMSGLLHKRYLTRTHPGEVRFRRASIR